MTSSQDFVEGADKLRWEEARLVDDLLGLVQLLDVEADGARVLVRILVPFVVSGGGS